ncbi:MULTISPECIES: hypothetical protein [Clostridium]|uniref:hypothetical protein n=1 Tax=Clostridium TaxID=1485 RepID=UPI0002889F23|nr:MULTISPECIES: hypothetical protein [Clostridium]MBU5227082.1 hypothetical protein [Clostridium senegalense]
MLFSEIFQKYLSMYILAITALLVGKLVGFKLIFFTLALLLLFLCIVLRRDLNFHEKFIELVNVKEFNRYMLSGQKKQKNIRVSNVLIIFLWSITFLINAVTIPWKAGFKTVLCNFIFVVLVVMIFLSFIGIFVYKDEV